GYSLADLDRRTAGGLHHDATRGNQDPDAHRDRLERGLAPAGRGLWRVDGRGLLERESGQDVTQSHGGSVLSGARGAYADPVRAAARYTVRESRADRAPG